MRPARTADVFVAVEPGGEPLRSELEVAVKKPWRGPDLVTAEMLLKVANGSEFLVPRAAIVTDLAREEAWRRGIRFVESATTEGGRVRVAIAAGSRSRAT